MRSDLRWIALVGFVTLVVLLVADKLLVSHKLSSTDNAVVKTLPEVSTHKQVLEAARKEFSKEQKSPAIVNSEGVDELQKEVVAVMKSEPLIVSRNATMAVVPPLSMRIPVTQSKSYIPIDSSHRCARVVTDKYGTAPDSESFMRDLSWCKNAKVKNRVQIGRSWGSLSRNDQQKWDNVKCNELMTIGKLQSCSDRWGWGMFDTWVQKAVPVVSGVSNVTCARNFKTSAFCQFGDVKMDFRQMITMQGSRGFTEGFITTYGEMGNFGHIMRFPGHRHIQMTSSGRKTATGTNAGTWSGQATSTGASASGGGGGGSKRWILQELAEIQKKCDIIEDRPTFIVSNDDIFNLGHYYNDLVGVWAMLALTNTDSKRALLINMDGLRRGGPAGGGAHRIMTPGNPDNHGPYIGYYQSWFSEVKKARDYANKQVCFRELYLPPAPGIPWFWNDWGQDNDCSLQAASPLYQSYNLFMRERWQNYPFSQSSQKKTKKKEENAFPTALLNPPTDLVHVVIEVRAINPAKLNNHSSSRHIRNLQALVAALRKIPGVKVTAQDFAKLSFAKQVALSHTAGVFISMHGAGTTHIFHAALGQPNCCALVELFPDRSIDLYTAKGYGNLARMLGLHHFRHVSDTGTTHRDGTDLNVEEMKRTVSQAVDAVRTKPTCLHDVKNTTRSDGTSTGGSASGSASGSDSLQYYHSNFVSPK